MTAELVCVRVRQGTFTLEMSLELPAGMHMALVGPNGAGKSTVLRVLAGLREVDAGAVRIDGRAVDDAGSTFVPAERRSIGVVLQDYALFPHLSALDNVAFPLRARGSSRKPARAAAQHWLERLEVEDVSASHPSALSGGQAQRVALARALIADPALVLLDEPTAALDAQARPQILQTMADVLAERSVVLISHDAREITALCDQVTVLEGGRVVQSGPIVDVAAHPATAFARALLGGGGPAPAVADLPLSGD